MTHDEKQLFRELGARIAGFRKEHGLTQTQLADELGLTQQMVASYEVGRRRVPVSLLPAIAEALAVSLEQLIGQKAAPAKRSLRRSCSSRSSVSRSYRAPSSVS
jgi:transcriptional regulator with XRE-family HTH domain